VNDDGTGTLVTKVADGQGGYPPGKLIENRTQDLSKEQTQRFLEEVKELGYWDLPTREKRIPIPYILMERSGSLRRYATGLIKS
jgi:hypothetical protein